MRFILVAVLMLGISGCGTVSSVFFDDEWVASSLKGYQTQCDSLPRAFSGVAYDFCVLNGPPRHEPADTVSNVNGTPLIIVDFFLSVIFDIVVLPYTVYAQVVNGNLEI
ncbi:YceK/YidQ family lipoprotein [Pseudomonas sp. TH31]|nr:YceK/YidQ family lipoprotein [Pseudomonas sp. TH31]